MMTMVVPLVVAVVGALLYALSSNPKIAELGRLLFFCGVFFLVATFAGKQLHL